MGVEVLLGGGREGGGGRKCGCATAGAVHQGEVWRLKRISCGRGGSL